MVASLQSPPPFHLATIVVAPLKLVVICEKAVNAPANLAFAPLDRSLPSAVRLPRASEVTGILMLLTLRRTLSMIFDLRSGLFLADQYLKFAGVANVLAIDRGDHIADLQASFCSGRAWFDFRNHPADSGRFVEELRVLGRHVHDSDSDVAVAGLLDFAVTDEGLHRRPHDLRWSRKSHPGEGARPRD